MIDIYCLPSVSELTNRAKLVHKYMVPSIVPHAVVVEGLLTDQMCDAIISHYVTEPTYEFHGCNAITRECPRPLDPVLASLISWGHKVNKDFWQFDVYDDHAAWLQTYNVGNDYGLHTDGSAGQSRKLTVVAFLTDPEEYSGGELQVIPYPEMYTVPRTRGTLVIFPAWVLHQVTPVTRGTRQTINLGFWGPPFK